MTSHAHLWSAMNARHLMAGVRWVRAKLEALAAAQEPPAPPRRHRLRRPGLCGRLFGYTTVADDPPAPAPAEPHDWTADEREAWDEMRAVERELNEAGLERAALPALAERLRLTAFETDLLLLCAAAESNFRIDPLCGRAQGDARRPYPTLNLALTIFAHAPEDWQALAQGGHLRRWMLADAIQPPGSALLGAAVRIDQRALEYLQGSTSLDARLLAVGTLLPAFEGELPRSQEAAAQRVRHFWHGTDAASPTVRLTGPDREGVVAVVRRGATPREVFVLPAERLPAAGEADVLALLWERERHLFAVALCVEADQGDPAMLGRFLGRVGGPVAVTGRDVGPALGANEVIVEVPRPTVAEQKDLWQAALPPPGCWRPNSAWTSRPSTR